MYKIVWLACLLLPASVFSQVNTSLYTGDAVPHDLLIYDGNGQPMQMNDHSNIEGMPYLQNQWTYGKIKLANGSFLSDSSLNLSLYDNRLYFVRNGTIYPVSYPVKSFSINNATDTSHEKKYLFQSGYPKISKNDTATFYEVLYAGNTLQLLKWMHKSVRENDSYNTAIKLAYAQSQEYFIFYPKENKMTSLGNKMSLGSLKKKLNLYANDIETYSASHPVNTGKEEAFIQLFFFLNPAE